MEIDRTRSNTEVVRVLRTGDNLDSYLGDTGDHVLDVALKSVNSAGLLVASEPHANSEVGSLSLGTAILESLDFARKVVEILNNCASGSLHGHFSRLDLKLNYIRKVR